MLRTALLLALALVVAGCGVRTSKPFTAKGTAPCLEDKDFTGVTTDFVKVGFVAGNAANGGLQARAPSRNVVTIAFTEDADSVTSTEQAFRRTAGPTYRNKMRTIMFTSRNAVMVWTTSPDSTELDTVTRCLRP